MPGPTPEGGLFGPPEPGLTGTSRPPSELLDWVSASAWAEAPWDPDMDDDAVEDEGPVDLVDDFSTLPAEDVVDEPLEVAPGAQGSGGPAHAPPAPALVTHPHARLG